MSKELKHQLYTTCLKLLNKRAETAKYAMEEAQNSANEEGKSSMGDKYETARAMGQIVRDMNAKQLQAVLKDLAALKLINPETTSNTIQPGSAVKTSSGNFFIAVSVGQVKIEKETWFALSPAAPLAQALLGKKTGDKFPLKGKQETILEVC